ncbi:MAG TPA: cupin domain-containing protein [Bryobacteraceae bacterium]|nr:cupin domain-containing protein [Bryobacteraceae bacterium]
MDQYNWTIVPREELNEKTVRQVIHTERMTIARLLLKKGAVVGMHQHENEQVTMMKSGALRFVFGGAEAGKEIIVRAGDVLRIPPHVPHMVEALEESMATDLFAPRREDWIRGDDAYLRNPSR